MKVSCKFCLEILEQEEWAGHVLQQKHKENLPSRIIVKGNFETDKISEIHAYFAEFGEIAKGEVVLRNDEFVFLIQYFYRDPMSYCTVVHKEHMLLEQKLDIGWCEVTCLEEIEEIPDVPFADFKLSINALLSQLQVAFSDQVAILKDFLQSNAQKIEIAKKAIRDDLSVVFSVCPGFQRIHFFGSTVTGLAIPGSNVDVHLQNVSLAKALDLLEKSVNFVDVDARDGEDYPVIRCKHVPTNMICHVKMGNKVPVRTSELIKYYVDMDEKIHSLMLVIKIWAKYHNLGDSSSYAFHLLVIFFLQAKPYLLPSVAQLQKDIPSYSESGWNCAIPTTPCPTPTLQDVTVVDLVMDFFKFYEQFDYIAYLVSPYCGPTYRKTFFLTPTYLPPCYATYRKRTSPPVNFNCGLSIQDPFEHSRIMSWKPSERSSGIFAWRCRQSLSLSVDQSQLLHELFNQNHTERVFTVPIVKGCVQNDLSTFLHNTTTNILTKVLTYQIQDKKILGDYSEFRCDKHFDVWTHRVIATKRLVIKTSNEIDRESIVSSNLKQRKGNTLQPDNVVVRIDCLRNPMMVRFVISGDNDVGPHLDHFLRVKIPKLLRSNASNPTNLHLPASSVYNHLTTIVAKVPNTTGGFAEEASSFFASCPYNNVQWKSAAQKIFCNFRMILKRIVPARKIIRCGSVRTGLRLKTAIPIDVCIDTDLPGKQLIPVFEKNVNFEEVNVIQRNMLGRDASVLRCLHRPSGIRIRGLIGCRSWLKTDKLIQYYLSLDGKVRELILVLKLWLNAHKSVLNVALYMLVIFYLQHEPYRLPAVVDLQKGTFPVITEGWNYAFTSVTFDSTHLQSISLFQMLEGFFKFYEKFDLFSYAVCPYLGYAVPKADFVQPYNLPSSYDRLILNNSTLDIGNDLFLQHPFNHSQNLVSTRQYWSFYFVRLCRYALSKIHQPNPLHSICQNFNKGGGKLKFYILDFSLEKPEAYNDEEFVNAVEGIFRYTLINVLLGNVKNEEEGVCQYRDIWDKRGVALKQLQHSSPADATELQKEEAISKSMPLKANDDFLTVTISRKLLKDPVRALFKLSGPEEKRLVQLAHYLRVKMAKFLEETKTIQEYVKSESIVSQEPVKVEPDAGDTSYENFDQRQVEIEQEEGEIFDDEEEQDDVPDNFFDDFSKEEFLDGLIDHVEEDAQKSPSDRDADAVEGSRKPHRSRSRSSHRRYRSRSRGRRSTTRSRSSSRSRSRSRSKRRKSRSRRRRRSRSRSRSNRRYRDKRKRTSSRSSSPKRVLVEVEKQPFFQEIRDKINGVYPGCSTVASVPPYNSGYGASSYTEYPPQSTPVHKIVSQDDPIHTLFSQKEISLSDYVTVLNKRQGKPVLSAQQLLTKTKIISRCMQLVNSDNVVAFRVRPSPPSKSKPHPSPIHKSMAKFKFTSPIKESTNNFSNALYGILKSVGIAGEVFDNEKLVVEVTESLSSGSCLNSELATQILQISLLGDRATRHRAGKKRFDVGTQTVPV